MTRQQRLDYLIEQGVLTSCQADVLHTSSSSIMHEVNQVCSENVLGAWPFPFSVVPDFPIAGGTCCLPMVEETSVVAAMNKSAKWLRSQGRVQTSVEGCGLWGQLLYFFSFSDQVKKQLEQEKASLLSFLAQGVASRMHARGGGVLDLRVREIGSDASDERFTSIEYLVDSVDAMGANFVNQVGTVLSKHLQDLLGCEADVVILSNHQPHYVVTAEVVFSDFLETTGSRIAKLSRLAEYDPYRAVTHNKGIMNGVDAVLLATGNDWRAASATIGAYASQSGKYLPLSTWSYQDRILSGKLKMPIACATVGGVVSTHPMAKLALSLLGSPSKHQLMQIIAVAGLLQNLSALHALVGEGINAGHMRLHIQNFIHNLAVPELYRTQISGMAEAHLRRTGNISQTDIARFVKDLVPSY